MTPSPTEARSRTLRWARSPLLLVSLLAFIWLGAACAADDPPIIAVGAPGETAPSSTAPTSTASSSTVPSSTMPPRTATSTTRPNTATTAGTESVAPDPTTPVREATALVTALVDRLRPLVSHPDPNRPPYERDRFFERADLDGDCLDTRHEVLLAEAREPTLSADRCKVVAGRWYDPFTATTVDDPAELQVDHVVALGDAWRSGAWAWGDRDRELFSNDLHNLNAIVGAENQRKEDDGPADYSPANRDHTCAYLVQYGAVKVAWGLSITASDFATLEAGLAPCDPAVLERGVADRVPPTSTVPGSGAVPPVVGPPTPGCHVAYSPCLPDIPGNAINCSDLRADQKPVTVLIPDEDPYRLDGDGDGSGCEGG